MSRIHPGQSQLADDHDADRRDRDLFQLFRAHTSDIFHVLAQRAAGHDTGRESPLSLATCEKIPTSRRRAILTTDPELADQTGYELAERTSDATEAIHDSLSRDRDRQELVLELIQAGHVAHARRLASCCKRSVELGCTSCGEPNYVPMTCDSRLCPECGGRRMGQAAGRLGPVVADWDHPTMFRLSLSDRVDPDAESLTRAVDALRGAFGRLRRRVVPPDGDGWSWSDWMGKLRMVGERDLAARLRTEYVNQGRGIPMDELLRGGFYAVDIKQKDDRRLNVHLHVLADAPWIPQAALSALWDQLIDAPVVDVRRVYGRGEADAESAVMEVVGYAAKPPEYQEPADEVAYYEALAGSKLIQPFGDLHGNTPSGDELLRCGECRLIPMWGWEYRGVVDGAISTVLVGSAPDGDRPPDASHQAEPFRFPGD